MTRRFGIIVTALRLQDHVRERPEVRLCEVHVQHRLVNPLVARPQHQLLAKDLRHG
jgi:hypothetical protein